LYLTDSAVKTAVPAARPPADIEVRFKYNQDFDSIYAMVPANMSLLLGYRAIGPLPPAPTGSSAFENTIGTVRVARCSGPTRCPSGRTQSWP
jgi:hypothetical protein